MEAVLVVAVLVGLWWAFRAKRASEVSLRYQVHKDALSEAAKILKRYPGSPCMDPDQGRVRTFFNVRSAPPECRDSLQFALECLEFDVEHTAIPRDIGSDSLEELLSNISLVRRVEEDDETSAWRQVLRAHHLDEVCEELKSCLERHNWDEPDVPRVYLRILDDSVRCAAEARSWRVPGRSTTLAKAGRLVRRAQEVLRAKNYVPDEDDSDR